MKKKLLTFGLLSLSVLYAVAFSCEWVFGEITIHTWPSGVTVERCACNGVNPNNSDITYLPHPQDLTFFYECFEGKTYARQCATGLHFDPENNVCDWPKNTSE